jgi:effector-binding domain-containing protein
VHVLPATEVAYAVYSGSYDDFGAVGRLHVALRDWVTAHGSTTTAPVRELYLEPPGPSGPDGVMELQYPLR